MITGQFIVAMGVALVLNEKFPGRFFFRTAVLVPIAMPTVILALTWQWMYDPFYGLINHYLIQFGIIHTARDLGRSTKLEHLAVDRRRYLAWLPFHGADAALRFAGYPDRVLRGRQGRWGQALSQRFRHVTLPQMRTTIAITLILNIIWWWNHFDIIMIVGSGGTQFGIWSCHPAHRWPGSKPFAGATWRRGAAISVMSMLLSRRTHTLECPPRTAGVSK